MRVPEPSRVQTAKSRPRTSPLHFIQCLSPDFELASGKGARRKEERKKKRKKERKKERLKERKKVTKKERKKVTKKERKKTDGG